MALASKTLTSFATGSLDKRKLAGEIGAGGTIPFSRPAPFPSVTPLRRGRTQAPGRWRVGDPAASRVVRKLQ